VTALGLPASDSAAPDQSEKKYLHDPDASDDEDGGWGEREYQGTSGERSDSDDSVEALVNDAAEGTSDDSESEVDQNSGKSAEDGRPGVDGDESDDRDVKKKREYDRRRETDPRIVTKVEHTLAIVYIACLILRMPVVMFDLLKYASTSSNSCSA